jgi:uncharacterized membrane protein YdbT with pleckstrin-like domain
MGRAKEFLSQKERIVYETHLHWVLFADAVGYFIIAILFSIAAHRVGGSYEKFIHYLSLPFWLYGGIKFLLEWVQHRSADFIITNSRVIIKVGVLKRSSLSIPLSKIESIEIDQTLIGQLFGFGSMHITGTGTATSKFEYITAPGTFRQKIQHATNLLENAQETQEASDQEEFTEEPTTPKKTTTASSYRKRFKRR